MNRLNRKNVEVKNLTTRVVQFGEGNFLRAFADWMIHKMNQQANFDGGVIAVQPIKEGLGKMLNDQGGLYTLYLNGIKNGQAKSEHEIVDCIQKVINPYENYSQYLTIAESADLRFVISNTTEAGISYHAGDKKDDMPPSSFPGKLTVLLYERFKIFDGHKDKGLIIMPCELIDRNGDNLKKIVLQYAEDWKLGKKFVSWINGHNVFCNTLVDRIVPGYPSSKIEAITKELGYEDRLIVEGEQFHLWVIEGPKEVQGEFPSNVCGINTIFTDDMEPYRTRKVRILNGAHTCLVPVGYLFGIEKVRESLEDDTVGEFLKNAIFDEIIPTLDLPKTELYQFANDVLDRFKNPYLDHALMSISLNSISKYKTRVLPSVLAYVKRKEKLPKKLLFSFAALIVFYRGEYQGKQIVLNDDKKVLDFFEKQWESNDMPTIVQAIASKTDFWGTDLSEIPGFVALVSDYLDAIMTKNLKHAIQSCY